MYISVSMLVSMCVSLYIYIETQRLIEDAKKLKSGFYLYLYFTFIKFPDTRTLLSRLKKMMSETTHRKCNKNK